MGRLPWIGLLFLMVLSLGVGAVTIPVATMPASDEVVSTSISLSFTASASGNLSIAIYRGSDRVYEQNVTGTNTFSVGPVDLSEGIHTIVFNVTADDGSYAENKSTNVIVDTTDPTVTINSPSSDSKKTVTPADRTVMVNYTYTDANPLNATLQILNSNNQVIANASITSGFSSGTNTKTDAVVFPLNRSEGLYKLRIVFYDKAGRSSIATLNDVIMLDNSVPALAVIGPTHSSRDFVKNDSAVTVIYRYTEENPLNITLALINSTGQVVLTNSYSLTAGGTDIDGSALLDLDGTIPDGLYGINVTLYDLTGQKSTVQVLNTTIVDSTPPTVPAFTLTPSTVTVGETIDAVCTAEDNSEQFGALVNISIGNLDTSQAHTRSAWCEATDLAGNSAINISSYTVLSINSNATNETNATANATAANETVNATFNATNTTSNAAVNATFNATNTTEEMAEESANETVVPAAAPAPEPEAAVPAATEAQPAPSEPVEAEGESSGVSALLWGALSLLILGAVFGFMYYLGRKGGDDSPRPPSSDPHDYVPSGQKVKLSDLMAKAKEEEASRPEHDPEKGRSSL